MLGRTLILCKSVHHQNTARVARIIADTLVADLRSPEEVLPSAVQDYDLVGFGSGIYFGRFHSALRRWIEQLPDASPPHRRAFVFSTAGLPSLWRLWHWPLKSQLLKKGFEIVGEFHCSGFDTVGPLWLIRGLNRGHPDGLDLENTAAFARRLLTELSDAELSHPMCSSP